MEKQLGEVFISKTTGSKLVVQPGEFKGRCSSCIFKSEDNGCCKGLMHNLRQLDVGHCSKNSRSDGVNVYFEQIESLYKIPDETWDLIGEINTSDLGREERENSILFLLNVEYLSYLNGSK